MTIYKNPMKIIFIHGMNQQNYNADTLKQFWLDIFKLGISELQLIISTEQLNISLPFYGDLITKHQLSNQFDLESFLPKSLINFHLHRHTTITSSPTSNFSKVIPGRIQT
ncbi:hypothetical protein ACG94X_10180 [Acinetobacter sp. ULE_I010]|uniref:hypothetical protein n=1 Tax=Acinetobacter sp. ULE_I010 TaxID=3373065 RepID=UPI003AF83C41